MFTDIEGSTRLHQRLGARFAALIAEHDGLLNKAIAARGGVVINSMGDGLFAAFGEASAAVAAATDIQLIVANHRWPDLAQVRVRIGLHSGPATPSGKSYVALAVHQAARVAAAAHGGQVVATESVVTMACGEGAEPLRQALGEYRLKDFDDPVALTQLIVPNLPEAFPPLRAAPVAAHNVPEVRSSFVGRRWDLEQLASVFSQGSRLVSVLGPGGVGKTRLAFELTRNIASSFPDGGWVVLLANAQPHELDERTLQALRVPQQPGVALRQALLDALGPRRCLLVFDNCEHVAAEAAALVAEILDACPGVTVLSTSREPLRLADEVEWRLLPLSPTDEAAELFVQRATARNPRLSLTAADLALVEDVCRAVDGLPLAVELVAARLRHTPLADLTARLQDRLRSVTAGDRTAEPRQRSLHDLVDWSYALLNPAEQRLLRMLSVFRSPMRHDAIEAVANDPAVDDRLASLVDKSLVVLTDDRHRPYRMLVVIRDFAMQKLTEAGEADAARRRHADWHVRLANDVAAGCDGPDAVRWVMETDNAYDDLAAAMEFADQIHDGDTVAKLATQLFPYYTMRGRATEARRWLQRAADSATEPALTAVALSQAGQLAVFRGDLSEARRLCEAGLQQAVDVQDPEVIGAAHSRLAHVFGRLEDFAASAEHARAATSVASPVTRANGLIALGAADFYRGNIPDAERHYRAAYELALTHGLLRATSIVQMNLGELLIARHEYDEAEPLLLAAAGSMQEVMKIQLPLAYEYLSQLSSARGDNASAASWRDRALTAAVEIGDIRTQHRIAQAIA